MVEEIKQILDDYIECSRHHRCDECIAHICINETTTTFCEMLTSYKARLQDRIIEVIEKN